jgi:hypothetical protein
VKRARTVTKHDPELFAYFGHHRCASTWISGILRHISAYAGMEFAHVHHPRMFGHDLGKFVRDNNVGFLAYVTATQEHIGQLDRFKGFHVIRDPRDICVSAYFAHLYSHPVTEYAPQLAEIRDELGRQSKDEGLLAVIKHKDRQRQFEAMYDWDYARPNVLEIKMEDLVSNPYEGFVEVFDYLGLLDDRTLSSRRRVVHLVRTLATILRRKTQIAVPLPASRRIPVDAVLVEVYNNRFAHKSGGRERGEEDVTSHYRKGVAGDWVNHFKEEHIGYFKQHYNEVLMKLGYESSYDW